MKTINKIAVVQVSYCIGGIICYTILDFELKNLILTHVLLTMGYLHGFWSSKN